MATTAKEFAKSDGKKSAVALDRVGPVMLRTVSMVANETRSASTVY